MENENDSANVLETVLNVLHEILKNQEISKKQYRSLQSQLDDLTVKVQQIQAVYNTQAGHGYIPPLQYGSPFTASKMSDYPNFNTSMYNNLEP